MPDRLVKTYHKHIKHLRSKIPHDGFQHAKVSPPARLSDRSVIRGMRPFVLSAGTKSSDLNLYARALHSVAALIVVQCCIKETLGECAHREIDGALIVDALAWLPGG